MKTCTTHEGIVVVWKKDDMPCPLCTIWDALKKEKAKNEVREARDDALAGELDEDDRLKLYDDVGDHI